MAVEIAFALIDWGVSGATAVAIAEGVVTVATAIAINSAATIITSALTPKAGSTGVSAYSPSGLSEGGLYSGGSSDNISSSRAQGLLINETSNVAPIPLIYGRRRVGGSRVFIDIFGAQDEYLDMVIVLGEGEIDSVTAIYLDDVLSTDAKFGVNVTTEIYTGTDGQAASALLMAAHPDKWTAQHTGSGVAYLVVRLWYDAAIFTSLPTITADVLGKKVLDVRTGVTAWSCNPALCIYDYLTNTRYGRGISSANLDTASFIAAANHCDETVAVPGGSQLRYTLDGVVDINATAFDNLKSLLTSCRGMLIYSAGTYRLVIDKLWTETTFLFNEDNITGDWSISQPGRRSKINRTSAGIFNAQANWQPDYAIVDAPAFRVQDNGLLLEDKLDLPFTCNLSRGCQIAGMHMRQSRFGVTVQFSALQEGLRCEVGDVFTITHSTPGWTAKKFRCMQMQLTSDDEVSVMGLEYDDSVYALGTLTTLPAPATISLGNPFDAAAPANLALTSGASELLKQADGTVQSRLKVTWTPPTSVFVNQSELQLKLHSSSVWVTVSRPAPASGVDWLAPVLDGGIYDVRLRFINSIGITSAWAEVDNHTVIGKTEPPADVQTFTIDGTILSWVPVPDIDLAGYELRFHYGNNGDWGTATPISTGLITESPFDMVARPSGVVTVMIKALDTTGNYSYIPALIVANLGDAPLANVVETIAFDPAFAGTLGNCSVSGGDLLAGALDSFYDNDAASFYGADTDPFYIASAYGAMVYTTADTRIGSALAGSVTTLVIDYAGTSLLIEYRLANPDPLYGEPGDSFYGPAADEFYPGAGVWMPWPGQITATNDVYQFRITLGSGATQGRINALSLVVDAPDMIESVNDLAVSAVGTAIPYTKHFISIKNIQATLQANGSGAVTVEIDKTLPLAPTAKCFNSAHTAVSGATVDFSLKGY